MKRLLCLSALCLGLLACGAAEGNTQYSAGFNATAFSALNNGASAAEVQQKLGAPLASQGDAHQMRLGYSAPRDKGKPYVRKEVLLRDGRMVQRFDEPSNAGE